MSGAIFNNFLDQKMIILRTPAVRATRGSFDGEAPLHSRHSRRPPT